MTKKKRVLSVKQKAALAKGRAKMAAKRGRKKLTPAQKRAKASSRSSIARKSQAKGFTDTPKKKARRIRRRKQNTEPGYFPNPKAKLKTFYVVGATDKKGKKFYFNGSQKMGTLLKAYDFPSITPAKQTALNLDEQYPRFQWFVEPVKKK